MKKFSERRKRQIEKNILKEKRYKVLIYNRFIFSLLLVALNLAFVIIMLSWLYDHGGRFYLLAVETLALVFVLYLINSNEKPSTKLNWVILILALPVYGVPAYLLFGRGRPTKKMKKAIGGAKEQNKGALLQSTEASERVASVGRQGEICEYLYKYAAYPAYTDGDVKYYPTGKEMFQDMVEELEKAEKYILLEYFIIAGGKMWDTVRELLLKKAEAGVDIRIIYDEAGSLLTLPPKYDKYLESLHPNIRCMRFNHVVPIFAIRMNNRDHRKMLVVDGKVAFTGGVNIADEYIDERIRFGVWKDTGVRLRGGAVDSFVVMFFNLWNAFHKDVKEIQAFIPEAGAHRFEGDPIGSEEGKFLVQPYDDSPLDGENVSETVYLDMINSAEKYVWVFTPYLVLDDFMRSALCNAAKRGVDVRIVTPGIPDKRYVYRLTRANYPPLLRAGVKILEYTPGFVHAKSMISDDKYAIVGTTNLDYRSLYLHFENSVFFTGCTAVDELKKDNEAVFAECREMTLEKTRRSFFGKLGDSILRVFETLL